MNIMHKILGRKYGKWEHIMFVEKWTAGNPTYDIRRRICTATGTVQYKSVEVGRCVHNLDSMMTAIWKQKISANETEKTT